MGQLFFVSVPGLIDIKKEFWNSELSLSGRRGSNPRPSAWKANALSTELLPHFSLFCGQRWIRTTEGVSQQIYSLPHLATLVFALSIMRAEDGAQTRDPQLGRLMLYQLSYFRISLILWARMDSNHRRRKPADLQSAPFGHSGTCPFSYESGRRGSNPRPSAWKANALSTELLPHLFIFVGKDGFEPPKA